MFAVAGLAALPIGVGWAEGGAAGSGDPSAQVPAFTVPAWVDRHINETRLRFERWRGADETVVFPVVTDIHAARPLFSLPPDFRDTKFHVLFARRAALAFKADFVAELGDIGFDRDLSVIGNWASCEHLSASLGICAPERGIRSDGRIDR